MSLSGDALGRQLAVARQAAIAKFEAQMRGKAVTGDFYQKQQLAVALAEGGILAAAIANTRRIFFGTNPNPDPSQFQDGDLYFIVED